MFMRTYGKKEWLIADCFYDSKWNGQVSHEAVCVLNTSEKEAHISFTLFFEDSEPITGFSATCGSMRTHHIRMDKILNDKGEHIPVDTPYALLVESDVEVVCQYSRLDTAQSEMALMTTIAY